MFLEYIVEEDTISTLLEQRLIDKKNHKVVTLALNELDQILYEENVILIDEIEDQLQFLSDGQNYKIKIFADSNSSYDSYVELQNEVEGIVSSIYDSYSLNNFGVPYQQLSKLQFQELASSFVIEWMESCCRSASR